MCVVQVLAELKEYATEVDVDFVRKAVRAIGRCAIKVEVGHVIISCFPNVLNIIFHSLSAHAQKCHTDDTEKSICPL